MKKKFWNFLKIGLCGIILVIFGIVLLCTGITFNNKLDKAIADGTNDISVMKDTDYSKGMAVYGYVPYIYDEYCEENTTHTSYGIETSSDLSAKYYVVCCFGNEDDRFISLVIKNKKNMKITDELVTNTWNVISGDMDKSQLEPYYFVGKVEPLDDDAKPYLVDWINSTGWYSETETDSHVVGYQLVEYSGDKNISEGIILIIVGIVICGIIAALYIISIKHGNVAAVPEAPVMPVAQTSDNTAQPLEQPVQSESVPTVESEHTYTEVEPQSDMIKEEQKKK